MDRSPEKLPRSQAKLQHLDANSNVQTTSHEECATNPSRGQVRPFNSETLHDKSLTSAGCNPAEKFLCRKSGYAVAGLAQCFQVPTPSAAMAMNLHGWPAMASNFHTADPRSQNAASNLLYTYGGHPAVMPNLVSVSSSARYDSSSSSKPNNARPDSEKQRSEREVARTESVIKTASDRGEQLKTVSTEHTDKRLEQSTTDTPRLPNNLSQYPARELENKTEGGKELHSFIESGPHGLSDAQLAQLKYQHKPAEISTFAPVNGSYRPHGISSSRPENDAHLHQPPYSLNEPRTAYSRSTVDSFKGYNYRNLDIPRHSASNASPSGNIVSTNSSRVPAHARTHSRPGSSGPQVLATSETERSRSPWKQSYSHPGNSEPLRTRSEALYPVRVDQARESHRFYVEDKSDDFHRRMKVSRGEDFENERGHPNRSDYTQRFPQDCDGLYPRQHYAYNSSSPVACVLPSRSSSENAGIARSQKPRDILTDTSRNALFDSRDILRDSRSKPRETVPGRQDSSRGVKDHVTENTNFNVKRLAEQTERNTPTKTPSSVNKNQGNVRNEKPVLPESLRYKIGGGEGNRCSKSDKVIVYDKEQGMSIGLSVRENSNQNSFEYFSNGRQTTWDTKIEQKDKTSSISAQGTSDIPSRREVYYGSNMPYRQNKEVKDEKAERTLLEKSDNQSAAKSTERGTVGEYNRPEKRSPLEPKAPSISPRDYGKKVNDTNDNNNNSAGIPYRYGNGFYGNVSLPNGEIGRYVPRISSAQERDFRPPNATLEMYERREQELERIGYRKLENVSLPTKQDIQNARKNREHRDDKGQAVTRNESNGRTETLRVPYERTKNKEQDSSSSDEDELQIVSEDSDRPSNGGSQPRQASHRPPPAGGQVCTPRTSPPVVERERNGGSVPLAAYNPSVYSNKRAGSVSDVSSRDARSEEIMDPNLWRFGADGKAYQQLMEHYNTMYNTQMLGMQAMPLIAPYPIMLFPEAGPPYVTVNPMEMVDPRLWSLQEAASRDQYLQHQLHMQQQLHLQQSKDPFWAHMQQGGHIPWLPFQYYKQFEADKKEEVENRKPVEEEKHQKQQETTNKPERKEPPNPAETTPTSRGAGKDSISRSEDSRLPAYNEQISRSEVNGQKEEAQRVLERHSHQRYQDMQLQESKKQSQNLFTADSRQSPKQEEDQQPELSEKLQKLQEHLMEKSQPSVSAASLSKRDTSSMSLLSLSTSGSLTPPTHTDSCSVSPTTASAAMTLSNLEKNARSVPDLRDEVPVSNRDRCDVESRPSIETRGVATENESTRGGADTLRGDVAAGEKAEGNVSERSAGRIDYYTNSVYNTGMDALGRVAAECSLMEQNKKQSRDSETGHSNIKLERTGSFDDHKPHSGFVSDEDDQGSNNEYETSPETLNHDRRLFTFNNQEIENQKTFSVSSSETLDVWKQLKEVRDGLSNIKSERTSRFVDAETKNHPEFDSIKERFAKNRTFKDERVYETKYEYKSFAPVMLPCRKDMFLAEKENIMKQEKIEAERKKIRENINRCRLLAKRRNSKDRFTVLSHRRDTRSPTTILNSVTSSISDMIENNTEKEMRMKLAELQKRYRERMRELSRLQPKCKDGNDDGSGKNQPKRGPGRPRKRKYFAGGTKYSTRPSSAASNGSEFSACAFEESLNGSQNLNLWRVDSDESLHSRDVEPVKKKKKKTKVKNKDSSSTKAQTPTPADSEETPVKVKLIKKLTASTNKAGTNPPCKKVVSVPASAVNDDVSGSEQEATSLMGLEGEKKKSKSKKEKKIKKRGRPKTDLELSSANIAPESSSCHGDTTQQQSPVKLQKTKKIKKKKKKLVSLSALASSETDLKSEARAAQICKVAVQTLVAKETDIMDTEVPIIRYKNSDDLSDEAENDEVFEANRDDEDGLNLLAAFAAEVKPAKRQRERSATPSSDHSAMSPSKRRGRPKKPTRPSSSESETPTTTKKRVRKLSAKKATSPLPLKVVSPPTVLPVHEAAPENKVAIPLPEVEDISEPESETKPEPEGEKEENLEEKTHNEGKVPESRDLSQETAKKGRRKSGNSTPKEIESTFPFLPDELWQRRRSERIFLNSSSVESPSPLSSPSVAFSFGAVAKKPKKSSKLKKEKTVSLSSAQSESETPEALSDTSKQKSKPKRRKSLGSKGKKKRRISSTAAVESEEEGDVLPEAQKEEDTTREFEEISEAEMEEEHLVVSQDNDRSIDFIKPNPEQEQPTESDSFEQSITVEIMKNKSEQEMCNEKVETALKEEEPSGDKQETAETMVTEKMEIVTENKTELIEEEVNEEHNEDKSLPDTVSSSLENQNTPNKAIACEPIERSETAKNAEDDEPEDNREQVFTFTCEELVQGTKVILPVDGVFFRGFISIIQEPDLYGVVLAGERGRRPHWRATDQLLTQAVKDVVPNSKELLSVGTRVCAHWSPQYRCFYPGTVTEAPEDEKEQAGKVWIEFDDGDSGIFPFCEVRRILSGRPVEDAESSPAVISIEPKKRTRASYHSSRANTKQDCIASESNSCSDSSGDEEGKMTKTRSKQNNKRQTKKNETQSSSELNEDEIKSRGGLDTDSESEKPTASKKEACRLRKKEPNTRSGENMSNKDTEESKSDSELNSVPTVRHSKRKLEKSSRELNRSSRKRTLKERSKLSSRCNDSSDQVDESTSDGENVMESKVTRSRDSSKYSDLDLRKKSLTLSLCSSTRSGAFNSRGSEGESPRAEHDDDSESYSDTFDESPLVESKQFQPRLPRRRRSELDRLQMDLKSSGQLWQWSGRSCQKKRRGKGRKVFYKAICRADETICIGDCAVFMSSPSKSNNLPYVGKIENMWEGCNGCMMVRVKWFYHPEETKKGRRPADAKAALYISPHVDENDIQTISHRCEVLSQEEYKRRMQTLENANTRSSTRSDRLFCCIGKYDPTSECFQTD